MLQKGLLHFPFSTELWRQTIALLVTHYDLEERAPLVIEHFLASWAQAEREGGGRWQDAQRWLRMLAIRHQRGLGQITYWAEQLLQHRSDLLEIF